MKVGDKDPKGNLLRLDGAYAKILQRKDGVFIVRTQTGDHLKITAVDALGVYNSLNGTSFTKLPRIMAVLTEPTLLPSARDPEVMYEITQSEDGQLWCTCPGFGYRRTCKHTDFVKVMLEGDAGIVPEIDLEEL